jgi:hypothetical protein
VRVVRSQPVSTRHKTYQRDLILTILLIGAGLVLLLLLSIGLIPIDSVVFWIVIVIAAILLVAGIFRGQAVVTYRQDTQLQDKISDILEANLGNEFIYLRNLMLPGVKSVGEIDGVLLGPPGAVVIQIELSKGDFAIEGDTWYRYLRGRVASPDPKPLSQQFKAAVPATEPRRRLDDSPTWACIRVAREVKAWLSVRRLPQVVVHPMVILGKGRIRLLKRPSAPAVEIANLEDFIKRNFLNHLTPSEGEILGEGTVEQIATRLQSNGN